MIVMTQKEKDLLLRDLCGRLPYGVKVDCNGEVCTIDSIGEDADLLLKNENGEIVPKLEDGLFIQIEKCKPYLFPLSSMTEEQKREYNSLRYLVPTYHYEFGDIVEDTELHDSWESIDYLIANHFDYRGLIPMGAAIDATNLNIY